MKKILALLASVVLVVGVATSATATNTDPNEGHKVTICHRTGSATGGNQHNGYDIITVDIASSGYVQGGHTNHEQVGNGPGGDVIPAYDAWAKDGKEWVEFHFPGKNLGDWDKCHTPPPPVKHDPTLEGSAVCHPAEEEYVVKYTGNTDGADSTVPDLPVIRTLPGTATSDSQEVTFKYSDGPDVTRTAKVSMNGDCTKDSPVTHEPTLQAAATCDLIAEEYTVTYTGNTDGAESTVPTLPVIHVVPATDKDQKDSATVEFVYTDGPNVTLTASITLPAGCVTDVKGEKEHNRNNDTNVKGGFAYTL